MLNQSDNPERRLVDGFLATRNERAFRGLYEIYTPVLYLFSLRMLKGNEEDAQDAVQETWLRAATNLGKFQWQSSLRTWLVGIAINCCRELTRDRLPADELTESDLESYSCSGPRDPDLESLIRQLPAGCRQVLVLHDIEGYTHDEIGERLNVAPGTSKHQLFRARAKLRDWLSSLQPETL